MRCTKTNGPSHYTARTRGEKSKERQIEEQTDGHETPTPKVTNPCVALCEATILLPWLPLVSGIRVVGEVPLASGHTTASIGARPCVPSDMTFGAGL